MQLGENHKVFFDNEFNLIEFIESNTSRNNKLIIVFHPLDYPNLLGNGFGGDYFLSKGFDLVAFKTVGQFWYQDIPLSTVNKISEFIQNSNYNEIYSYGSSMGGFGAIVFSNYFKITISLTYSPQCLLSNDCDPRWINQQKLIAQNYGIDSNSVHKDTIFHILYDDKDQFDSFHINELKKIINADKLHLYKLSHSGHAIPSYLNDVNCLKYVPDIIFSGGVLNLKILRKKKKLLFKF